MTIRRYFTNIPGIHSKNKNPVFEDAVPVKRKREWYVARYVVWLFFKIGLCSAVSFERSQLELSIDVAEHRSILKNNQSTYHPRFSFIPKTGTVFPKAGVLFVANSPEDISDIYLSSKLDTRYLE